MTCVITVSSVIILALIAIKLYVKLTTGICKSKRRLDGKTVIITGGNAGIGKETAIDLAKRGARVILACRDLQRGSNAKTEIEKLTGSDKIVLAKLDLASLKSVREFVDFILKSEKQLDILINNAGLVLNDMPLTEDGLEYQMASNYFGHFLLTNLLLDLLKKSKSARIINVSAKAHEFIGTFDVNDLNFQKQKPSMFFTIYSTSKLCNILFTRELAKKLNGTGITVNSLHPGVIVTEFTRRLPSFVHLVFDPIAKLFLKSPYEGAQTTIYLAVSEEVEGISGQYFSDCKVVPVSRFAQDDGLAKKLWENTEELVGYSSK